MFLSLRHYSEGGAFDCDLDAAFAGIPEGAGEGEGGAGEGGDAEGGDDEKKV